MKLPVLTHLQFVVLRAILDGDTSGREIRERLSEAEVRKSLPAFYQLMARLEESGFVAGRYETSSVDGQTVKSRNYSITAAGHQAVEATQMFYLEKAGVPGVVAG